MPPVVASSPTTRSGWSDHAGMDPTASLVEQARRHICALISQERMPRDDRLPYRELGEQFGMAYATVKFAMDDLAGCGGEHKRRCEIVL